MKSKMRMKNPIRLNKLNRKNLYLNIGYAALIFFFIYICYKTYKSQKLVIEGMTPDERKEKRLAYEGMENELNNCKEKCKDIKTSTERNKCNNDCKQTCGKPCYIVSDCGDPKKQCEGLKDSELNECMNEVNNCIEDAKNCNGACGISSSSSSSSMSVD